jgi:hypothetical protein
MHRAELPDGRRVQGAAVVTRHTPLIVCAAVLLALELLAALVELFR